MDLSPTHHRLQDWYRVHGRHHLPWRNTDDPYAIYISEMMLQQTQVQTVLERFYHPFMTRFPTLTSLAETTQEDVLKMWEGLGYYRRAKYVYKTAQQAGNSLPATVSNASCIACLHLNRHLIPYCGRKQSGSSIDSIPLIITKQ